MYTAEELKLLVEKAHSDSGATFSSSQEMQTMMLRQATSGDRAWYKIQQSPFAFSSKDADSDPIYIGFEWETRYVDAHTSLIKSAMQKDLGWILNFRSDSNATEIVSIPATLAFHKEFLEQQFFGAELQKHIVPREGYTGCGVHVHISKKAFTEETLRKFTTFIINPVNNSFIDAIAERPMYEGVSWRSPNRGKLLYHTTGHLRGRLLGAEMHFDAKLRQVSPSDRNSVIVDKHHAVNSGTGYGTVELRIFNSATDQDNLFKCLEFADALTRFVRVANYGELYAFNFALFIAKNKKQYPVLFQRPEIQALLPAYKKIKRA